MDYKQRKIRWHRTGLQAEKDQMALNRTTSRERSDGTEQDYKQDYKQRKIRWH